MGTRNGTDSSGHNEAFVKDICRHEFRAFLSVDIDNSSALKQPHTKSWYRIFYLFFNDFRESFLKKYSNKEVEKPTVWKNLGDEIIFQVELNEYDHIRNHIKNFFDSIREFNTKMSCKGTIWLAEFPVYNMRIDTQKHFNANKTEDDHDNSPTYDYIGKSMDAGFRLSKFATHEKLVLSVEVMFMFACVMNRDVLPSSQDWCIRINSTEILKGVYGDAPYPIFWIDNRNSFPDSSAKSDQEKIEDAIFKHDISFKKITDYCYQYIKSHNSMCVPFMKGNPKNAESPQEYEKEKAEIETVMHNILSGQGENTQSPTVGKGVRNRRINQISSKKKH